MSLSLFLRSAMLLSLVTLTSSVALGQMLTDIPAKAKDIGVDEKLGGYVPADLVFENELGKKVRLGDMLAEGKPILLTLNYSGCPGLCVAQLDGLVRGVEELRDVWLGRIFSWYRSVSIREKQRNGPRRPRIAIRSIFRRSMIMRLGISGRVVPMLLVASLTRWVFDTPMIKRTTDTTTWLWRWQYRPKERLLVIYMT